MHSAESDVILPLNRSFFDLYLIDSVRAKLVGAAGRRGDHGHLPVVVPPGTALQSIALPVKIRVAEQFSLSVTVSRAVKVPGVL